MLIWWICGARKKKKIRKVSDVKETNFGFSLFLCGLNVRKVDGKLSQKSILC